MAYLLRPATQATVCFLLLTSASTGFAAIVACADADGRLTFSQFGCPAGTLPPAPADKLPNAAAHAGQSGAAGLISFVDTPPLSETERATLSRLNRSLASDRAERAKTRRQSAARRAAARQAARRHCETAERALAAIEAERRRGYSAAEERRYDAEEARWKEVQRDC
ncbi:MAG TPA: hypothetical protein VIS76_14950 [Pseudomonadales bacterium]